MTALAAGLAASPAWAQATPDGGVPSPDSAANPPPVEAAETTGLVPPAAPAEAAGASAPLVERPVERPVEPPAEPPVSRTVVSTRRAPAGAALEDLTATASVVVPADSRRAVDDLGTLLLEVPGANLTRRGGLGSLTTLSLRGSNPEEVRFYVDGVPLNQAVGGAVDLSTLPLGDVERIEVYRGSSPIVFGQSALGGVVSISTHTPGAARASLRAGAGSFSTVFGDASVGGQLGPVRLYAGVHTLRAAGDYPQEAANVVGGYQPATRENNGLIQWDGVFRATLPLPGRRELRAGFLAVARDQGRPVEDNFQSKEARLMATRAVAHLAYESRDDVGDGGRLRALVYAGAARGLFSDPLAKTTSAPIAIDDLSRSLGATVNVEKALGGWARLVAMAEGRGEDYQPRNGSDPLVQMGHPARRQSATGGLELTVPWRPTGIDVVPSGRVELFRDTRTDGQSGAVASQTERALPIYRLGLARAFGPGQPGPWRARATANVGRYARIPSFVELFGYNRDVVGNPQLLPERGWNADVGASLTRASSPERSLLASVTLFGATVEDLIAWRTYSYQTRAENVSRARIWGVETELRGRFGRFGTVAQATLTDARDRSDVAASRGRQIAHHPRYRGYGRADWRQPAGAFVWSAYADAEAVAGVYKTATVHGGLPARLLVGAGLGAEHVSSGVRLVASAANLTDSRVEDFPGYPLPGRSIFVSLGWSSVDSRPHTSNP
jgi:outer membrane cobalamin receptor